MRGYHRTRAFCHRPGSRGGWLAARLGRTAAALASASVITLAVSLSSAPAAMAGAGSSTLSVGHELQAGQELVSVGGQYTLVMQSDGNLVIYGNGCALWASGTVGTGGAYLNMQTDGNLVIYTSAAKPVWSSGTAGTGSSNTLNMQEDGNLVIYTSAATPVWASGAAGADQLCAPHTMGLDQYLHSPSAQYKLLMQDDGNLVLYGPGGATWASNTVGTGGAYLNMQSDGNLVIYTSAAKPVWSSGTAGTGSGGRLVLQDDGSLVLYTSAGKAVWTSRGAVASTGKTAARNLGAVKNCTWWAINEFHAFSGLYPYFTGNAKDWAASAASNGWTVISTAQLNSIAVFPPGVNGALSEGHVAWVTGVSGSQITISEMNGPAGFGKVDTRTLTPTSSVRYILAP
jgi:surface antigen